MFSGFHPPFWSGADYGRKCIENYSNSGVFCVYPVRTSKLGKTWEFRHPHVKVQSYALLLSHQSANLANYNTVNSANYLIPLHTISRSMTSVIRKMMRDERKKRSFCMWVVGLEWVCVCLCLSLSVSLWVSHWGEYNILSLSASSSSNSLTKQSGG